MSQFRLSASLGSTILNMVWGGYSEIGILTLSFHVLLLFVLAWKFPSVDNDLFIFLTEFLKIISLILHYTKPEQLYITILSAGVGLYCFRNWSEMHLKLHMKKYILTHLHKKWNAENRPIPSFPFATPIHSSSAPKLKILTYNFFMRPPFIADFKGDYKNQRIIELIDFLIQSDYDIICFQEMFSAFHGRQHAILEVLKMYSPFIYQATCKSSFAKVSIIPIPGIKLIDSGLVIVSRYPIVSSSFIVFDYSHLLFSDNFTAKGCLFAQISYHGRLIDIFNTHTQAGETTYSFVRHIRRRQFNQILDFVRNSLPKSVMNFLSREGENKEKEGVNEVNKSTKTPRISRYHSQIDTQFAARLLNIQPAVLNLSSSPTDTPMEISHHWKLPQGDRFFSKGGGMMQSNEQEMRTSYTQEVKTTSTQEKKAFNEAEMDTSRGVELANSKKAEVSSFAASTVKEPEVLSMSFGRADESSKLERQLEAYQRGETKGSSQERDNEVYLETVHHVKETAPAFVKGVLPRKSLKLHEVEEPHHSSLITVRESLMDVPAIPSHSSDSLSHGATSLPVHKHLILLIGDFNIDSLSSDNEYQELLSLISAYRFSVLDALYTVCEKHLPTYIGDLCIPAKNEVEEESSGQRLDYIMELLPNFDCVPVWNLVSACVRKMKVTGGEEEVLDEKRKTTDWREGGRYRFDRLSDHFGVEAIYELNEDIDLFPSAPRGSRDDESEIHGRHSLDHLTPIDEVSTDLYEKTRSEGMSTEWQHPGGSRYSPSVINWGHKYRASTIDWESEDMREGREKSGQVGQRPSIPMRKRASAPSLQSVTDDSGVDAISSGEMSHRAGKVDFLRGLIGMSQSQPRRSLYKNQRPSLQFSLMGNEAQ